MGCASKTLTGEAFRIYAAPSGFRDKCLAAVLTKVIYKRLVDVVDQIRPTVAQAIIIILVDVIYQPMYRSIYIFHFAQFGCTDFVEVSRTRPLRTWTRNLVKSLGGGEVG